MKAEWYVEFKPNPDVPDDIRYSENDRLIGPFPYEEWARGWAFIEMKNFPLSWWSIKNHKAPPKPKTPRNKTKDKFTRQFKLIKNRADSKRTPW